MFSYYIQASWKICVLEISFKKSLLEKENTYFSKTARWLLLNKNSNSYKNFVRHIRFSRRKKFYEKTLNFPGELSQNFVRTDTIFQEIISKEQIFCKIASADAFVCCYNFLAFLKKSRNR